MKIQVLGTGCGKCKKLFHNAEQALRDAGLVGEVEKVSDINDIIDFGIMVLPALAIDGEVKVSGRVATPEQIKGWLTHPVS